MAHHDRLAKINARPIKAVLFTGPPGAGKAMLGGSSPTPTGATLSSWRSAVPQFISKWVGQSEEILRLVFDYARKQKRCTIFFDEIDSVGGQRTDDSHESPRRVVAQLLTNWTGSRRPTASSWLRRRGATNRRTACATDQVSRRRGAALVRHGTASAPSARGRAWAAWRGHLSRADKAKRTDQPSAPVARSQQATG